MEDWNERGQRRNRPPDGGCGLGWSIGARVVCDRAGVVGVVNLRISESFRTLGGIMTEARNRPGKRERQERPPPFRPPV